MGFRLTDAEIAALVAEVKQVGKDWRSHLQLRPKKGHSERDFHLTGEKGNKFLLILRQSNVNVLDFSLILAFEVPSSNRIFRLRRYNGKSHEHTNSIERNRFYDFHIHMATERYQDLGTREDAYAEPTARYADFHQALRCLMKDANILVRPQDAPGSLFEEE